MISRRMPDDPKAVERLMGELKGGELAEGIVSRCAAIVQVLGVHELDRLDGGARVLDEPAEDLRIRKEQASAH